MWDVQIEIKEEIYSIYLPILLLSQFLNTFVWCHKQNGVPNRDGISDIDL